MKFFVQKRNEVERATDLLMEALRILDREGLIFAAVKVEEAIENIQAYSKTPN
jgi:hypothetical protein